MPKSRFERTSSLLPRLATIALVLALACRDDVDDVHVATRTAAISTGDASTLGFEAAGKWSFAPGSTATIVGLSPNHTQGARSLEVTAQNYAPLVSVPLSSLGSVGSMLFVDVMLPTAQANPSWYGTMQMYANAPSVGVYSAHLGQVELTGLPLAKWLTIPFQMSADVATRLSGSYSDLTFTVALTVPHNQTGSYFLDNIRFAANVTPVVLGIAQNSAGLTKAVFTYQTSATTDLYIPYGPSNGLSNQNGFIASPPETPPQWFVSRAHSPFAATLSGAKLTWKIGSSSATATPASPLLPTQTGPDGSRIVTLPDGSKFNIDAVPPKDPPPASEPQVGDEFFGALTGNLTVGPSGSAMFTLPIALPPAVAGMAPGLSLVYNSHGANGIAGQGWDLGGLSTIHRCPKTRALDGGARPVQMDRSDTAVGDDTDGICLDGQRLFEDPAGSRRYRADKEASARSIVCRAGRFA